MENKPDLLMKLLLKNGHAIGLYADTGTIDEMVSHPKYLRMRDEANEVFISIEDIVAFEIINNRKQTETQEDNDKQATSEKTGV